MKHLVHLSYCFYTYHPLIILNEAHRLIEEGNEVDILICGGGVDRCYGNITGDKKMCFLCKKMQKKWISFLPSGYRLISYKDLISEKSRKNAEKHIFKYENPNEIISLEYKGVKIGYGAYSTYVSKTRNLEPLIDDKFIKFFNSILKVELILTDMVENYINKNKPDSVLVFNARHFDVRPFYDYPLASNISVMCVEAGTSPKKDVFMGFNYGKYQPHSIVKINSLIEEIWEKSDLENEKKVVKGGEFFENKRNNVSVAGGLVYTSGQKAGLLPKNWNKSKRNFVIFNSSEDEFVAVGDEYSKLALFPDQNSGIRAILNLLNHQDDIHIYLRVHPALKNVNYKYHTDLYLLEASYPNLTVIKAWDEISSYALIDNAEKVIVFGSTIGIEAVYWDKPVILLAGAIYYYMNQCYIPKSEKELEHYLFSKLVTKKNSETAKFGFYLTEEKGYALDKIKLKRTNLYFEKPLKINKESILDFLLRYSRTFLFNKLETKNKRRLPFKEK